MPHKVNIQEVNRLAEQAKGGDNQAFTQLFHLLSDGIFRYALLKLKDVDLAHDVSSETFSRALSYIHRYKSQNFRAYLYTIARNLCIDKLKELNRHQNLDDIPEPPDKKPTPEQQLIKKDEVKKLHQAILKLPPSYQEVISLCYLNELSSQEAAQVLHKSYVSLRVLKHRAINKLKQILK